MFEHALSPYKIGKLELSNRFVMPSMGSNPHPVVDAELIEWYAARAKGGFGLIITGFVAIDPMGIYGDHEIIVANDDVIPSLAKLPERIHEYDSKIFLQLHHSGRMSMGTNIVETVSSSAIPCPVHRSLPKELTTEEVYEIIEKYGDAALIAKKAGFDGVEVHAAHGYLPAQFMSAYVNRRTDEFGGDITGLAKFGVEIVKNIKKKCGKDFPVGMRLSGEERVEGGIKLRETAVLVKLLEKAGVDVFHISTSVIAASEYFMPPYSIEAGINLHAAEVVKKAVKVPVIAVGRLNDPVFIESAIEDGLCDFVAMGRGCIADAEFPNKVKNGTIDEISPCIGCNTRCNGKQGIDRNDYGVSCAFNPLSGHETTLKIMFADDPKKIVVVGGGVGGLETSWLAASRGHKVILLEKSNKLGGQVVFGMVPPKKGELTRAIKYYITMCKKHGVEIKMNFEATKENISALNPDAVVLATGAQPIQPDIPNDGIPVVQAVDLLGGKVQAGNRVLVVGGGLVGLETAEFLASQLRQATVVEMTDDVGMGIVPNVKLFLLKSLKENNVEIIVGTKVENFTTDGANCSNKDGKMTLSGFDMVVLAMGTKSYNPLEAELVGEVKELYVVGDAVIENEKSIAVAVDTGARLALKI